MPYPKKVEDLIEDFSFISNKNERTDMLIYYADQFKEVPDNIATRPFPEENRVITCESQAYVWSELLDDGKMKFYFAVENPQGISAKAMASILDETISGETPEEIVKLDMDVVYQFFGKGLSMGKSAGLTGMVNTVLFHAKQYIDLK